MIFLLLAILCSASIALIFKFSENRNYDRYSITSANYLMALSMSFMTGIEFDGCDYLANMILLGVCGGVFFFLSFLFYQISIRKNGASLSGAFGKMGILLPVMLSILIWNEIPSAFQVLGISAAIFSIAVVYIPTKNVSRAGNISKFNFNLLMLFFFGGMAEFFGKIFQYYFSAEYKGTFLFFLFLTAFTISFSFSVFAGKKSKPGMKDILTGIIVGIPNYFSSYFLIISLESVKAPVAFPAYSAGSILLINIGSFVLFGEKLKNREKAAVLIAAASLVFVNL